MTVTKRKKPVKRKKPLVTPVSQENFRQTSMQKSHRYTVRELIKHLSAVRNKDVPVVIAPYIKLGKRSIPIAVETQEIVTFGECFLGGGYVSLDIYMTMFNKEAK